MKTIKAICSNVRCNTKFMVGEEFNNGGVCPVCQNQPLPVEKTFAQKMVAHGCGRNIPAFMIPASTATGGSHLGFL